MALTRDKHKAPITCQARLAATPEEEQLLWAHGKAWGEALREVYVRCVVGDEPWFQKDSECLRTELIGRGSQTVASRLTDGPREGQDAAACPLWPATE